MLQNKKCIAVALGCFAVLWSALCVRQTSAQMIQRFTLPTSAELTKRVRQLEPSGMHVAGAVALLSTAIEPDNATVNTTGNGAGNTFDEASWWKRVPANDADRAATFSYAAWRLMPVSPTRRRAFDAHVSAVAQSDARHEWLPIYRLYQAMLDNDRDALLKAAAMQRGAKAFPSVFAEHSQMKVCEAIGVDRLSAGMHLLQHRQFESLYALLDLDRHLSREAGYLRSISQNNEADSLLAARDLLRNTWHDASRHVVERLFALNLLDRSKERHALLQRYEHYTKQMTGVAFTTQQLRGMDDQRLWSLLVEPALKGDLTALNSTADIISTLKERPASRMRIQAEKKQDNDNGTIYTSNVKIEIDNVVMTCSRAIVKTRTREDDRDTVRIVADNAKVEAPWGTAAADRLAFDARGAQLTLDDNVTIKHGSWSKARNYTAAVMTLNGNIKRTQSLLDDFNAATDTKAKLALLPKIASVYDAADLPDEAKLLRALQLLEPHLTWHAPHALPKDALLKRAMLQQRLEEKVGWFDSEWEQALGAEPWMTVPADVQQATLDRLPALDGAETPAANERRKNEALSRIYWKIKDNQHADVVAALKLLDLIDRGTWRPKARRWAAEIRRNNTVLTFDIPGGFGRNREASVVLDVRGAEKVSLRLYRVRSADDFRSVHQRIGRDFIYRDYGSIDGSRLHIEQMKLIQAMRERHLRELKEMLPLPRFDAKDEAHAWTVDVADLKWLGLTQEDQTLHDDHDAFGGDAGGDAQYFDDHNYEFERRLEKPYRPEHRNALSSWRADRVVTIPAKTLSEPGAYILVAEADGQRVYAPLLVDPLSLTLRRSRDGVVAVVSDAKAEQPVAGATVVSVWDKTKATTNKDGVAFHRVLATGDNAIIASKDGRFAVGGFGRVFDGLYRNVWAQRRRMHEVLQRVAREELKRGAGYVYADHHIIAAYTDRPTYRPGQTVRFKMIVRQLKAADGNAPADQRFRERDFDFEQQLQLPKVDEHVSWKIVNPRGRVVLTGSGKLNDFGTLAGEAALNAEVMTGTYTLRVNIDGMDRLVPDVFQVKNYRRPNFKVTVDGLPDSLAKSLEKPLAKQGELMVNVAGRYYFGEPVRDGKVEIMLVRSNEWAPLAEVEGKLGVTGIAAMKLSLPADLPDGDYEVITTLSDQSGRSVSEMHAMRVGVVHDGDDAIAMLPRFMKSGETIVIKSQASKATVRLMADKTTTARAIETEADAGALRFTFDKTGWHEVTIGNRSALVFVFGDGAAADMWLPDEVQSARGDLGWVNLTDFEMQEQRGADLLTPERAHVYALFDRHRAEVGQKVRLLVFSHSPSARVLITLEGRTVIDYHIDDQTNVQGDDKQLFRVIEVPVRARMVPNVFVQARLLSGEVGVSEAVAREKEAKELRKIEDNDGSFDPRWCRIDVTDLNRKTNGQRLDVSVSTDRQNYKPGDDVKVDVHVTGEDGQPREAELSLAAVDTSLYHFGEDQLDQLPGTFGLAAVERRYQPKAWRTSVGARWSDPVIAKAILEHSHKIQSMAKQIDHLKVAQNDMAKNLLGARRLPLPLQRGQMPVGQIALARLRTDFRETAAWLPQLRTDAQGHATATFKLPDSLTAWRVSAVGVTKGTQIGVGRAAMRSVLPLSVQVFTPRFAIENDRQQIAALIHNYSDQPRTVQLRWEIAGGNVIKLAGDDVNLERDEANDVTVVTTTVTAANDQPTHFAFDLQFDQPESVRIQCRVVDVEDKSIADAEQRVLQVRALGRPGKHEYADTFKGEKRIELPKGFLVENLVITTSRDSIPMALDGLDYLATYPHGCVEQTMSRFLPLVLLRDASQQNVVRISEKTRENLPAMLSRGLTRLYDYQHEGGSWGWFSEKNPDDQMSVYVIYGLVRCKLTGVDVDAGSLQRGLSFLAGRIRTKAMNAETTARALYVLALAGKPELDDLRQRAAAALKDQSNKTTGSQRCNLALACRAAGMQEQARQLWQQAYLWQPKATAELSLKLRCMVAFGESIDDCYDTAHRVLAQRRGHRWHHTRDTSWAIDALADLVGFAPAFGKEQAITIRVNDKVVHNSQFKVRDAQPHRVQLNRADLNSEGGTIVLQSDGDDPVYYSITAKGTQRLDKVEPTGRLLTMLRSYTTLEGKPISQPIRQGDVIAVRLVIEAALAHSYVLIEEFKPAGFEFADEQWRGPSRVHIVHTDFHDDRVSGFARELKAGQHELVYYLRAETPGLNHVLPGRIYPMYDERRGGETGSDRLEVVMQNKP